MAGDLTFKSLNIEFGADDSGFNKSLSKINGELRAVSTLGKQLDKDLKFDNAQDGTKKLNQLLQVQEDELKGTQSKAKALASEYDRLSKTDMQTLVTKQQNLADELEQSKAKTKQLNAELKNMKKAGDIDTAQYEALKQELDQSKNKTKELNDELKETKNDIKKIEPQNMARLGTEIVKTKAKEKDLNDEIGKTKSDIENLNSGEFDKLSDRTKQAGSEMKQLSKYSDDAFNKIETGAKNSAKEMDDLDTKTTSIKDSLDTLGGTSAGDAFSSLSENVKGTSAEMDIFGEIASAGPALLNPYTAAIVAVGSAIGVASKRYQENIDMQKQFAGSLVPTNLKIQEQTSGVRDLAKITGQDLSEATQIGIEGQQDFGNAIKTTSDNLQAGLAITALNNTGTIEAADAYAAATSNAANFGDGLAQHNETLGQSVYMMQAYGNKADDIIDTQVEWGDTFAATGQSSQQMFNILNAGMVAGARSTDEVANAWNEFQLRLGDGTAQAGIEAIGLSWDDTVNKFNAGGISSQQAFAQVVSGLLGIEDQTQRTAVAQSIFGTQGEEFIATLNAQKGDVDALTASLGGQKTAHDAMNETLKAGSPFWKQYQSDQNLTKVQVTDLQTAIKEQGLSAVDTSTKHKILEASLTTMGTKMGLNKQETSNLVNTYKVWSGQMDLTKISQKNLNDGLDTLKNTGLITKDAFNVLKDATTRYREEGLTLTSKEVKGLDGNIKALGKTNQVTGQQQKVLSDAVSTLGTKSITSIEGVSSLAKITNVLASSNAKGDADIKKMSSSVVKLGSSSASTKEKVGALKGFITELGKSSLITKDKAKELNGKIDDMASASKDGSTAQDGLKNKIDKSKSSMNEQKNSLDSLTGVYIASLSPTKKARVENEIGKKRYDELTGATDKNSSKTKENGDAKGKNADKTKTMNDKVNESKKFQNELSGALDTNSSKQKSNATAKDGNAKASDKEKEKTKDATKAIDDYNGKNVSKKDFKTNAKDTKKDIDDAKGAGDKWNLFQPKQKTFVSIFKTEHQDDGKGKSSGGSKDKSTQKSTQGATSTTFNPTIQINYTGSGNAQADGIAIGQAASRQMYKMGVVTK